MSSRFNDSGSFSCGFIQSSAARSSKTIGMHREFRRSSKNWITKFSRRNDAAPVSGSGGTKCLGKLRALHDRLLNRVLFGKQKQARIGYDPIKRGRRSYHPLLCFEGHRRYFWHGELRASDAHTDRLQMASAFPDIARAHGGCHVDNARGKPMNYDGGPLPPV